MSDQAINLNKSSVIFSPSTDAATRGCICDILCVSEVFDPGKYLGVPM